jgi:hypothetical protein
MTTYVTLVPNTTGPFIFPAVLDGQVYNVSVTWPVYSKRPYFTITGSNNSLIVTKALVGSVNRMPLSSLVWSQGAVVALTQAPHGLGIGTLVNLTIGDTVPIGYSGDYLCTVLSPRAISYPLPAFPGLPTVAGSYGPDLNLIQGYFVNSTMVFRTAMNQFEISP